jgi:CHAD domain-containing protein
MRNAVSSVGSAAGPAQRFLAALERQHARSRKAAVSALSEPRYFALLDTLDASDRPPLAAGPRATSLSELWWKEFRRTRREFALLDEQSADVELHVARIHVKRARYAAELAAHELGKPGERFVEAAKRLQDVLGEHQDSTVAEERILAWAHERAGVEDVADALLDYERKRRKKARRAWPAAWDRLVRRGRACRV